MCDNQLKDRELKNCNFSKMVLMICVIMYHSLVFWNKNWFTKNPVYEAEILSHVAKWLNSFHIYGFTLISGYIFYCTKCEKGNYMSLSSLIRKKAKRLLLPFVFTSALWVVPIHSIFLDISLRELTYKYMLATNPSQLWFLVMLFLVFIMAYLLANVWNRSFWMSFLSVILLYGIGLVGNKVFPNIFQIWTACRYVLFFWLGYELRKRGTVAVRKINTFVWVVADLALYMLSMHITGEDIIAKVCSAMINVLLHVVGALMAFVVLQRLASLAPVDSVIFKKLCQHSMTIYLLHQQIIYFVIYLLNGKINPYLNAFFNFVISVSMSLLLSEVLHRFKVTRFLIGEKCN